MTGVRFRNLERSIVLEASDGPASKKKEVSSTTVSLVDDLIALRPDITEIYKVKSRTSESIGRIVTAQKVRKKALFAAAYLTHLINRKAFNILFDCGDGPYIHLVSVIDSQAFVYLMVQHLDIISQ